jgi:hypothetical protein
MRAPFSGQGRGSPQNTGGRRASRNRPLLKHTRAPFKGIRYFAGRPQGANNSERGSETCAMPTVPFGKHPVIETSGFPKEIETCAGIGIE